MSEGIGTGLIMVVDDEVSVREIMGRALRKKGFNVIASESGEEALVKASQQRFDLIFLDVKMPGMSGLEVLAKMHIDHPSTIVVMLTAVGGYQAQHEASKHEAFDYLSKPCKLAQVTELAEKILGKSQERHLVEASP